MPGFYNVLSCVRTAGSSRSVGALERRSARQDMVRRDTLGQGQGLVDSDCVGYTTRGRCAVEVAVRLYCSSMGDGC